MCWIINNILTRSRKIITNFKLFFLGKWLLSIPYMVTTPWKGYRSKPRELSPFGRRLRAPLICADRHDEDVVPTRHTSVQSFSHLDSGRWMLDFLLLAHRPLIACPSVRVLAGAFLPGWQLLLSSFHFIYLLILSHSAPLGQSRWNALR